ncbi:MAG: flagellar M-ring protein FliF [Deltaproteobacteria bacterium]|jgi:flagellar M-ring protein FliF|nr:flagellar M-ring protein FliF [Deltaproteobacteria bacterium]
MAVNYQEYIARAKEICWEKRSVSQRIIIGGVSVFVLAGFLALMLWINKPEYKVLFTNLTPEDANRVVTMLQSEKTAYSLDNNGTTILVPEKKVYELRLKVAGEGSLKGSGIGYEIFDQVKVGQTDFVQKINYMRALQGELSRTIGQFPSVDSARVHLVMPQRSLFIEEQQKPSASVVLKLKDPSQKVEAREVQAILNMLVMSVEGLDKKKVSITDNAGKALYFPEEEPVPGLSKTQLDYINRVQQNLERRIEEMLIPVAGAGKIIAKVNVDMDFSQKTIRRELYDPQNSVVRSEQRSEETQKGKANLEAGTPDVNFRGDGITGSVSTQDGTRETRTTNYEINKEEQNIVSNVGDIQRLTVAVIVDGAYVKNADGVMEFVPRPAAELKRMQQLVANAVGISEARGDSIEVTSIPFGDREVPAQPNLAEAMASYATKIGKPLLNTLLLFLFLMLVVRPVVLALIRPKVEAGEMVEGLEGLPAAEEQLALYEAHEEALRAEEEGAEEEEEADPMLDIYGDLEAMKNHIFHLADQHMDQAVTILRSWMKDAEAARGSKKAGARAA